MSQFYAFLSLVGSGPVKNVIHRNIVLQKLSGSLSQW